MKRLLYIAVLCLTSALRAEEASLCMRQYALSERMRYQINISMEEPTTITFPSAITSVSGSNVTTGQIDPKNPYEFVALLTHREGSNFVTIRALKDSGKAGLNIVYRGKTYILTLISGKNALRSVKFYQSGYDSLSSSRGSCETACKDPIKIVNLIRRAKAYELIKTDRPDLITEIEVAYPNKKTEIEDVNVTLEQVYRFDDEDALVFRFKLKSKSLKDFIYIPQKLAVRVGNCVYNAFVSDSSGIVHALSEATGYFAICGKPNGERANLSVRNDFNLIITKAPNSYRIVPSKQL